MGIAKLDHYAIRTAKLEETRRFYVEAIGLNEGRRPPFDFPGAWLYQDGVAMVHLVGVDPNDKERSIISPFWRPIWTECARASRISRFLTESGLCRTRVSTRSSSKTPTASLSS